jgi:hypothetical protein
MKPEFTAQNPIVAAAEKIRARREIGAAIDSVASQAGARKPEDAEESLRAFSLRLADGCTLLNSIVGAAKGAKLVRLEKPLRVRLRFGDKRVALDLDEVNQLVRISGCGLDGDYQFDLDAPVPSLINLSKLSTEEGYGERVTSSWLLKTIARDAELPRPPHLDGSGPLQF